MQSTSNNRFLIEEFISEAADQAQFRKEQCNTRVEKAHCQVTNEVQYSNIGKNIIYNCHEQTEVQKMNNGIVVFSIDRVNQDQKRAQTQ